MKWIVMITGALALSGCGSSDPGTPTTPTPPPTTNPNPAPGPPPLTATIRIAPNNRFEPAEVTIAVGGRVTFFNANDRPHDIVSDPPHLHTDCPAIESVGFIQPGQTKQTAPLTQAQSCGFHDHMQENNLELRGRIVIQ
jgi:hypothetical protein